MKGDSGRQYRIQAPIELSFPALGHGESLEQGAPRGQGSGPSWSPCTLPRPHSSALEFPLGLKPSSRVCPAKGGGEILSGTVEGAQM